MRRFDFAPDRSAATGIIRKVQIIGFAFALLLALCASASAQQPKKVPRIGYLSAYDPATEFARSEAIRHSLRELGYIEGQNITFEHRYTEGKRDRRSQLAAELVRLNVALIVVAGGDLEIRAAMHATKTIPLIMTGRGTDPVKAGFIESLSRPSGNVTGLTSLNRELGGKRLELFKETIPKLARVAAIYQPSIPGTAREVKEDLPVAAHALGLIIQPWEIPDTASFERVFSALGKERPDGLYASLAGTLMRATQKRIADFALKNHLPSVYDNVSGVDAGGLMYYGANFADSHGRVAAYIDKILKGAKPAELPVEQPTKFESVINLNTAKKIGLTIPPNILARADKVIR